MVAPLHMKEWPATYYRDLLLCVNEEKRKIFFLVFSWGSSVDGALHFWKPKRHIACYWKVIKGIWNLFETKHSVSEEENRKMSELIIVAREMLTRLENVPCFSILQPSHPCGWYVCLPQPGLLYQRPGSFGGSAQCLSCSQSSDVVPGICRSHSSLGVTAPSAPITTVTTLKE